MTIYFESKEIQQNGVILLKKEVTILPSDELEVKLDFETDYKLLSLWVWLGDNATGNLELEFNKYDENWANPVLMFDFYLDKDKLPFEFPDIVIPKDINYSLVLANHSNNTITNIFLYITEVKLLEIRELEVI